jgi:hypothetical protein
MRQQPPRDSGKSSRGIVARIGGQRGAIDRRQAFHILFARVGPPAQQPRHHLLVGLFAAACSGVAPSRSHARISDSSASSSRIASPLSPSAYGAVDLVLHRRNRGVGTAHPLAPVLLLLLDRGDDVRIAAVPRQRERRGRIAMREDALARVGAGRHQQTHHRRVAPQHRVMQGLVEMGTSGLMSGDGKRGGAASAPAPILDSTGGGLGLVKVL